MAGTGAASPVPDYTLSTEWKSWGSPARNDKQKQDNLDHDKDPQTLAPHRLRDDGKPQPWPRHSYSPNTSGASHHRLKGRHA